MREPLYGINGLIYTGEEACDCGQGDEEWVAHWHGKTCPARTSSGGECECEGCRAKREAAKKERGE